jgi:hypothetical protein
MIKLGDKILYDGKYIGVVLCNIDRDDYPSQKFKEEWSYLKTGIIVDFNLFGLVHFSETDEDITLID